VRNLIYNANYTVREPQSGDVKVGDFNAFSCISSLKQAMNSTSKPYIWWKFVYKVLLCHLFFSFQLLFYHKHSYLTQIAASNRESGDVTN